MNQLQKMTSVPHLLVATLEELGSDKLKTFKWYFKDAGHALAADVEKAEAITDTVDLMVRRRGPEGAVKITLDILEKMKEKHLAEQLQIELSAITEQTVSGPVQGLNTQPLNCQPGISVKCDLHIALTGLDWPSGIGKIPSGLAADLARCPVFCFSFGFLLLLLLVVLAKGTQAGP